MPKPSSSTDAGLIERFDAVVASLPPPRPAGVGLGVIALAVSCTGIAAALGPFPGRPWLFAGLGLLAAGGVWMQRRSDPRLAAQRVISAQAIGRLEAGETQAAVELLAVVTWSNGPATWPLVDPGDVLARLKPEARAALLATEAALQASGRVVPIFGIGSLHSS